MAIVAGSDILASDFVSTSSGASDSGKVPKLNADGILPQAFYNKLVMVADEDITTGWPVGVSNYITGLKVARALRYLSLSLSLSYTSQTGLGVPGTIAVPIGGDKFVFVDSQVSDDSLYATVGVVTPGSKTIALGTSLAVTADITASIYNICKLDTDKFAVFYREDASTTIIKYRVGTVSGTTITFGTAATFFTGGTASDYVRCDQISTNKGIVFVGCLTVTDSRLIAFTVSGTVITAGTPLAIGTTIDNNIGAMGIKKIATDKFIIAADSGSTSSNYCQVGTLSGTTITLGTETVFSANDNFSSNTYGVRIVNPSDNVVVIQHTDNTNIGETVVGTVSGTTPTFGTPVAGNQYDHWIYADSSSSVLVGNVNGDYVSKFTFSGTTLTSVGQVINRIMSSPTAIVGMDNGYFIVLQSSSTSLVYYIQGMSNNFCGIAQSTVSKGASLPVLLSGAYDSSQANLIPGGSYLISNGGLTFQGSGATDNTVDDSNVLALSATQILLKK